MPGVVWWAMGGGAAVFLGSLLPWISVYVFDGNLFGAGGDPNLLKTVEVSNSISGSARAASAIFGLILIALSIAIQSTLARGVLVRPRAYAYGIPLLTLSVLGTVGCGIFAVAGYLGFREADGPRIVGYGIFTLAEKRPILGPDGTAGSAHVSYTPAVGLIMILLGSIAAGIGAIESLRRARPRPLRARHRKIHTFHLHPVRHAFVGGLCAAIGAFFLGFPVYGLFSPGFYKGSSAWETAGLLLMGVLVALVCAWVGIHQFRCGAQVSGQKLMIRNELRSYAVDAADIRALTIEPKQGPNASYWVARIELTSGKGIWIDNFDCGRTSRPPKPDRVAIVAEVRALLGVGAEDIQQSEAERLLSGTVTDSEDLDRVSREMTKSGLENEAANLNQGELDETLAQITRIEAIISKSLKWLDAVISLFLIIAIPDPAAGETDDNLPPWMWWGIGIAVAVLLLTLLALKTHVPRRIAELITTNRKAEVAAAREQEYDPALSVTQIASAPHGEP